MAASWCYSFFHHSNNWFSACCSTALENPHNTLQLVFIIFFVLKLHQSFRQGCPLRGGCKLDLTQPFSRSVPPPLGLSPVWHRRTCCWCCVRQKAAAVPWRTNNSQTCGRSHTHTALVRGGSVESADVCVALVSIMLSFSVPLLGSSLRLLLRQHNLYLRLTKM